jgi:hypothetical protein
MKFTVIHYSERAVNENLSQARVSWNAMTFPVKKINKPHRSGLIKFK